MLTFPSPRPYLTVLVGGGGVCLATPLRDGARGPSCTASKTASSQLLQAAVHPPQECPGDVRTAFVWWEKPQPTPVVIPRS